MKRYLRNLLLFAACATAFVTCSKDQTETVTPDTGTATFRFSADTDPETDQSAMSAATRTEFDANYQLKWGASDEIGLFIASTEPTVNAQATPDLTVTPTVFEAQVNPYSVGDKVYAYYPYATDNLSTNVALTIPAAQEQPALGKFDGAYNPLVAIPTETTDTDSEYAMIEQLRFRQTAAMIAFNTYTSTEEYVGETIESISYTNSGDAAIAGTFSVDLTSVPASGEMPAAGTIENGSKTVEVTLKEQGCLLDVNDKETNIVYMAVFPGEYKGTVVVTTDKATYTFPAKQTLPLPRAYVRKIGLNLANATRQLRPFYEIKGVMNSRTTEENWKNDGWVFQSVQDGTQVFGIRLGTGSAQGSATSPAIENFPEKIEVIINAVAWNGSSENTTLVVSLLNADGTVNAQKNVEIAKLEGFSSTAPVASEAAIMSADNRHSVIFYAGGGTKKVRIEAQNTSNNRFALAYVAITATDAEIIVPPTISANDVTGISEEGVTDATFDFSVENDREYTAAVEFDGTVVTKAAVENHTVTYTVAKNTGDAREGWITITLNDEAKTQKTIKVAQEQTTIVAAGLALPFNDDFSDLTGNGTATNILTRKDATGNLLYSQSDKDYQYSNPHGLRLGTSSAIGYITTTALDLSEEFSVIVSAKAWPNDATALKVTAGDQTQSTEANLTTDFQTYILYFNADKSNATVRFEPATTKKRVIIESIQIVAGHASLPPTLKITSSTTISIPKTQTQLTTTYSIQNPIDGTSVVATADVDWISEFQYADGEVKYTVAANDGENAESRTGIITFSYGEAQPETVTITQAGNGAATYEATYTIASTNSVTTSGSAPDGSAAAYTQTYSGTAGQMTANNSTTLTLSGYNGCKITGLTLSMKSNKSAGAGSMTATAGTTTFASIASSTFNSANWYGNYSQSYVDIKPDVTAYTVQDGETITIVINATVKSLYISSYTITYEK